MTPRELEPHEELERYVATLRRVLDREGRRRNDAERGKVLSLLEARDRWDRKWDAKSRMTHPSWVSREELEDEFGPLDAAPAERAYDVGALSMLKRPGQEVNSYQRHALAAAAQLKDGGGSQNRVQAAAGARPKRDGQHLWHMLERGLLRADPAESDGLYVDPQVAFDDDGRVWLRTWDKDAFDFVVPEAPEGGPPPWTTSR